MIRRLMFYTPGEGGGAGAGAEGDGAGDEGAGNGAGTGRRHEDSVPWARFDEVSKRARQLQRDLDALGDVRKERDQFASLVEQLKGQAASALESASLARAGVTDDDHVEALRMAWGKVAEADRPKTLADYAKAVGEMKPEDRPRLLAGFYAAAEPPPAAKTAPRFPAQRASEPPANTDALLRELRAAREAVQADPSAANRKRLAEARAKLPG